MVNALRSVFSLLLGAGYERNQANLANYRYQNTTVSSAVMRTF